MATPALLSLQQQEPKADPHHHLGPAAVRVEIPGLPNHLNCYTTPSAGRTVIATKRIRKGDTAFTQVPYAHTIHYRHKATTCDGCFLFSDEDGPPLKYPCSKECGIYYCSGICRDACSTHHRSSCELIQHVQQQGKSSNNNKSMHTALSLLISIKSNDQPIDDVLFMMQDSSKKGMKENVVAEAQFRHLLTTAPEAAHSSGSSGSCFTTPKKGLYAQALATVKLNALGIYDSGGDEVGYALSPAMAMVNHSCLPNCQQITTDGRCQLIALCDIPVGEELSYSYVSLTDTTATTTATTAATTTSTTASTCMANTSSSNQERLRVIQKNWEFTCTCARCRDRVDCRAFDAEHTCYCGAVCLQVDRSIGSCVCNPPRIE
jgi:hypothetical protein